MNAYSLEGAFARLVGDESPSHLKTSSPRTIRWRMKLQEVRGCSVCTPCQFALARPLGDPEQ